MGQSLRAEIRREVGRYLAEDTTLRSFQEWFVPRAFSIDAAADPAGEETAAQIELWLAEYTNGDWTEDELRNKLRSLVARPVGTSN